MKERLTVLSLQAATTATRTSGRFTNRSARGLLLRVNLANVTTPNFTPSLQWVTPAGIAITIWTAAAALTAAGDATYLFYPGAAVGGFTEYLNQPIPMTWQVVLTRAAGTADTIVEGDTLV